MKKIITLLSFCFCAGMIMAQTPALKVHSSGNVSIGNDADVASHKLDVEGSVNVRGALMRVASGIAGEGAKLEFGEGRSAAGNAVVDLTGDIACAGCSDFGLRFGRFSNGSSQIQHRGTAGFVFNALDAGAAGIFFQTEGVNRAVANTSGLLPGGDNAHRLGTNSRRWIAVHAVNGTIQTSDRRLKSNIKASTYGLKEIMKLEPVTFNWSNNDDAMFSGRKIGFIAQDVQKVIPEVVVKGGDKGHLGMNYAELVTVVIGATQEQQTEIETLREENETLRSELEEIKTMIAELGASKKTVELNSTLPTNVANMAQNTPNPFNQVTSIEYFIPENTANASLKVFDVNGKVIQDVAIAQTGAGVLELSANNLQSGQYFYSLYADGKLVSTKKMILAK